MGECGEDDIIGRGRSEDCGGDERPPEGPEEGGGIRGENTAMLRIREIMSGLRTYLCAESSKVNKGAMGVILNKVAECEGVLTEALLENARLRGRLEELEKARDREVRVERNTQSYANVLKEGETNGRDDRERAGSAQGARKNYAVVVKGTSNEMTPQEVREKLLKVGKEKLSGVRVQGMVEGKTDVLVLTPILTDASAIANRAELKKAGLEATNRGLPQPKVLVYGVTLGMATEELMEGIFEKNLKEVISKEEFKATTRLISRKKTGRGTDDVVLELSKRVYERMIAQGRVYVGWSAFGFKEHLSILRCYKCLSIVHFAKDCRKEKVCAKCRLGGHLAKDCKNDKVECWLCKEKGWPADHHRLSQVCREFKQAEERERVRGRT